MLSPYDNALRFHRLLCSASNSKQSFFFTGIHVVLIMFTGYLVGYAAFRALFNHSTVMVTLQCICNLASYISRILKFFMKKLKILPFLLIDISPELLFAQNAAGGIIGLVCGMLVETLLFIIKTSSLDTASSSSTAKLKKRQ